MLQNLERGRGLLCRTLMKSQLASTEFSATFAALVAIINTKLPEVGELLLKRVVWQVGLEAAASTNAGALCLHAYHKAAASHATKALLAGLPCSSGGCGSWGWRQMQNSLLACPTQNSDEASEAGGISFPLRPWHC